MSFLRWLNLLSIDAMLIALAWQEVFTRTAHVSLRWQERALLGISVWIVYLLDHLLDSFRTPNEVTHSDMDLSCNAPRHHFARKHRILLLGMIILALLFDLLLSTTLSRSVFLAGATLGLLTFFYLLLNAYLMSHGTWLTRIFHTHRDEGVAKADETRRMKDFDWGCISTYCSSQNSSPTPHSSACPASTVDADEISGLKGREFIIATIFSFGCALVPLVRATAPLNLLPWVTAFAILSMINCILIARMERGVSLPSLSQNLIPSPRWLLPLLIVLLFLASNYYTIPTVAVASFMSLCGLSLIPMIAKRYGYEAASLATDGALFFGALLALAK